MGMSADHQVGSLAIGRVDPVDEVIHDDRATGQLYRQCPVDNLRQGIGQPFPLAVVVAVDRINIGIDHRLRPDQLRCKRRHVIPGVKDGFHLQLPQTIHPRFERRQPIVRITDNTNQHPDGPPIRFPDTVAS